MALELVKYVNSDQTWSAVKRGRRTMRRSKNKKQELVVLDYEKSGVAVLSQHFAEEVLDVPIKKRILLLRHQTLSNHLEESDLTVKLNDGISNGVNLKQIEKKVTDLNDFSGIELLAAAACVESSAVEELVTPKAVSCTDGVKDNSVRLDSDKSLIQNLSENGNCEVDKSPVSSKNVRLHWDLNTVMDDWEEEPCCDIMVDPHSEKSYLKDSFNDGLSNDKTSQVIEDEKRIILDDTIISVVPLSKPEISSIQENNNGDPMEEVKAITCNKTSELGNCASKLDVVESFVKCESDSTITASVIKVVSLNKCDDGQAVSEVLQGGCLSLKGDGEVDGNGKLTSDRLSDCCGSNVSEDERGDMAEGNTIDKAKSGYDSPAEDGELRESTSYPWEKIELEERECVDYESDDNMYEDNFDTIESVKNEITEHQKTVGILGAVPNNEIEQSDKADTSSRPDHREYSQSAIFEEKNASTAKFLPGRRNVHDDFPDRTSFGVRRNGDCIRRSRSDNFGDSYFRANRDFGPKKFMGRDGPSFHGRAPNNDSGQWVDSTSRGYPRPKNDQYLNYNNPRVNYRNFNIKPTLYDRNDSYGIHRGALPARDISRDRSRGGSGLHLQGLRGPLQEEYNDPEPCDSERKVPCFSSNYNRGVDLSRYRKRSSSRSRSGSPPIAWNFPKKVNMNAQKQSPERFPYRKPNSSGEIDRNIINEQYRGRKTSPVRTFHRDQKFNNVHPTSRPVRFPHATGPTREKFEVNSDEKYGMTNRGKRFRYDVDPINKDNGVRYDRKDNNRCFRDPNERDIPQNRSDEKGCRYTTNKSFNTAKGDFIKNNSQRE